MSTLPPPRVYVDKGNMLLAAEDPQLKKFIAGVQEERHGRRRRRPALLVEKVSQEIGVRFPTILVAKRDIDQQLTATLFRKADINAKFPALLKHAVNIDSQFQTIMKIYTDIDIPMKAVLHHASEIDRKFNASFMSLREFFDIIRRIRRR